MSEIRPIRTIWASRRLRALIVASVVLGVSYAFVMPFMSLFGTKAAKMSPIGFGVFMTIVSVSGILLSTALARHSDLTRSRKPVLLLGGVTGAIGYAGYAFLRDPLLLTVCGAIFIGLSSVTFSQLFAYARDLLAQERVEPAHIPLYMNVVRSTFALAWTAGHDGVLVHRYVSGCRGLLAPVRADRAPATARSARQPGVRARSRRKRADR